MPSWGNRGEEYFAALTVYVEKCNSWWSLAATVVVSAVSDLKVCQLFVSPRFCRKRSGIALHQDCIPACLESFIFTDEKKDDLSLYANLFHKALMKNTRALEVLSHETERASKYYPQFREQLVNLFGEVIVQQQGDFLDVWVSELIDTKQEDALRQLCQLLKTTNQQAMLQHLVGEHAKARVNSLLAGIPSDMSLIDQFLKGAPSFRYEIDEAFKQAINSSSPFGAADTASEALAAASNRQTPSPIRVAQYMHEFIDAILTRSEEQILANGELEEKISAAIILMKYIVARDHFWEYYQNGLRRRLLLNSFTSLELERLTVAKLRKVCHYESAFKCRLMISDIQSAEDLNDGFRKYLVDSNISLPISLYCNVLGANYWALDAGIPIVSFNHIPSLETCCRHFYACYEGKYKNRNLRWDLSACTAECKLLYTDDGRHYTLQLAAVHTAVFAHFEVILSDLFCQCPQPPQNFLTSSHLSMGGNEVNDFYIIQFTAQFYLGASECQNPMVHNRLLAFDLKLGMLRWIPRCVHTKIMPST
nr:CULlin family member (cul 2) [Hymenolepis microstoma]